MKTAYVLGAIAALIALPVACSYIGTGQKVATTPSRVIDRTLETDNVISSYEKFFDIKREYDSRVSQIGDHVRIIGETSDPAELSRLRMEVSAMRQSCRTLANQYAADSEKMNKAVFKAEGLPETLDSTKCEVIQ